MKININHPTFISFLEKISNNIITSVNVFSLIRNVAKLKTNLNEVELKAFITILWKKNEESENYELAEVLNDIITNFDKINEVSTNGTKKPVKRTRKVETGNDNKNTN